MATAWHEAGHAVMAISLGRLVQKVTIMPGKSQFGVGRLGVCEIGKGRSKASKDQLEDEILILLAGMVAESRFTGEYCQSGASQDLRHVRRLLAQRASSENQLERLQRRLLDKTEHLLGEAGHALAVELIARELLQKTTVSGRAVRHFFEQAIRQSEK
ncbi:ATP-dependent metallopeptidase FtsH/Yme1/Tma family protein [Lignipirellula cremea]|nr:cell division protein FtsH [Lignipirellula cremea]